MKKIISIITILLVLIGGMILNFSYAYEDDTYTLEFEVFNVTKGFDLYILLPKEYVMFAIKEDGLDIDYTGASTLKDNDIPSIDVDKDNVQDEVYEEDGEEYIQILLEENDKGKYEFDILSDYDEMNMKYRIKNVDKDYIVYIDNFKVNDGICKVQYDYEEDIVEQPGIAFIPFLVILLIIILIVLIIVGIIAYIKQRR